jgi:hypothetical protein
MFCSVSSPWRFFVGDGAMRTVHQQELAAANNHFGTSPGLGIFMLKACISGRGDELIDLAKVNLFR